MVSPLRNCLRRSPSLAIVDLGAAQFESTQDRYAPLLDEWGARITGFEPNPTELDHLRQHFSDDGVRTFLPYAVADGAMHELRVCRLPGCSSLLEPNIGRAAAYHSFAEWLEVEDRLPVQTVRLDDVTELGDVDLLKIDVQGGELLVIENANRILSKVLVVECEVEFVQQYHDQPLFSEIEQAMRMAGYQFVRLFGYGSRMLRDFPVKDPLQPGSQWLWSDALFVRDPETWTRLPDEKLLRLAIIMADAYQLPDFAYLALSILDGRNHSHFAADYVAAMANPASDVPPGKSV